VNKRIIKISPHSHQNIWHGKKIVVNRKCCIQDQRLPKHGYVYLLYNNSCKARNLTRLYVNTITFITSQSFDDLEQLASKCWRNNKKYYLSINVIINRNNPSGYSNYHDYDIKHDLLSPFNRRNSKIISFNITCETGLVIINSIG